MTMHPQAKNKANVSGMAVTVTLVFSDEAHRGSWLERMKVVSREDPDYQSRCLAQNLIYMVGPIGPGDFDQDTHATGTTCTRPHCGAPQYRLPSHVECQRGHVAEEPPGETAAEGKRTENRERIDPQFAASCLLAGGRSASKASGPDRPSDQADEADEVTLSDQPATSTEKDSP